MKSEAYIIIVIGILSAVSLNRGIHLYFNDRYEKIDNDIKKLGYNEYPIIFREHGQEDNEN